MTGAFSAGDEISVNSSVENRGGMMKHDATLT
jgi:hypothetical protein